MNTITSIDLQLENIEREYKDYVLSGNHPCVMAKSTFMMGNYHLNKYDDMHDAQSLNQLVIDLKNYISEYNFLGDQFESFLAVFPNNSFANEINFETALWKTLQTLHEIDDCAWDDTVSSDVESPEFSFSLGGKAFYIIGLHPMSSRIARQAPYPTLVFNLHRQFDKLRELGTFHHVRDRIRKNDEAIQGSINPVLEDFGADTEAKQYSGREVEQEWKCPFHKKSN